MINGEHQKECNHDLRKALAHIGKVGRLEIDLDGAWRIRPHPPITTRYVGTIAFQGTDAEIGAMQRRTFGKEERT